MTQSLTQTLAIAAEAILLQLPKDLTDVNFFSDVPAREQLLLSIDDLQMEYRRHQGEILIKFWRPNFSTLADRLQELVFTFWKSVFVAVYSRDFTSAKLQEFALAFPLDLLEKI